MADIKRIHIDQLKIGMYIAEVSNEWVPDHNMRRHGLIKRDDAIQQIAALGITEVYIDADKGLDCADAVPMAEITQQVERQLSDIQQGATSHSSTVDFSQEINLAKNIEAAAFSNISLLMNDVKMGNAIALQPIEDVADSIAGSILRNQSALSCLTRLRDKDQYLMQHSFSVAVLMGVLARSMGFSGDDLHQLVTGGLLHDIGKVRIPDNILYKPGTLTAMEWEEMKRHVDYGEQALDQPDVSLKIKQICGQHHERLDGTGYPRGLSASAIEVHGKMAAIVDVYDAVTSDRSYHASMPPTQAMKKILEWSGHHLDKDIAYQFIACMSIYPAGATVELESGKLAVVIEPNLRQQQLPIINLAWDLHTQRKLPARKINLAQPDVKERIKRAVNPSQYGFDAKAFIV